MKSDWLGVMVEVKGRRHLTRVLARPRALVEDLRRPTSMPIYTLKNRQPRFATSEWFIAPTAAVIGEALFGDQSNIWFNVVIRADNETITIGDRTNVQDGSVLH